MFFHSVIEISGERYLFYFKGNSSLLPFNVELSRLNLHKNKHLKQVERNADL